MAASVDSLLRRPFLNSSWIVCEEVFCQSAGGGGRLLKERELQEQISWYFCKMVRNLRQF